MRDTLAHSKGKLSQLIDTAHRLKLIEGEIHSLAVKIELAGNRVLHDSPTTDREAWATLCAVRRVLLHLYGEKKMNGPA